MFCVANWKMHGRLTVIRNYVKSLSSSMLGTESKDTLALICPPSCYLSSLHDEIARQCIGHLVHVGGQDSYLNQDGPDNGKINPEMLLDIGVHYVLLGCDQEDSNEQLQKKLTAACRSGMQVLFCLDSAASNEQLLAQLQLITNNNSSQICLVLQFKNQETVELQKIKHEALRIKMLATKLGLADLQLVYYGSTLAVDLSAIFELDFSGLVFDETKFIAEQFAEKFAACEQFAAKNRKK